MQTNDKDHLWGIKNKLLVQLGFLSKLWIRFTPFSNPCIEGSFMHSLPTFSGRPFSVCLGDALGRGTGLVRLVTSGWSRDCISSFFWSSKFSQKMDQSQAVVTFVHSPLHGHRGYCGQWGVVPFNLSSQGTMWVGIRCTRGNVGEFC